MRCPERHPAFTHGATASGNGLAVACIPLFSRLLAFANLSISFSLRLPKKLRVEQVGNFLLFASTFGHKDPLSSRLEDSHAYTADERCSVGSFGVESSGCRAYAQGFSLPEVWHRAACRYANSEHFHWRRDAGESLHAGDVLRGEVAPESVKADRDPFVWA